MSSDEPRKFELSRRTALLGGAGLATTWLSACDLLSTAPEGSDGGGGKRAQKGPEAPELAARVEAGELPPVKDRLPDEPLVVEPTESIGVYGGTWATAITGATDTAWPRNTVAYDGLVRWDPGWNQVVPNIAESFDIADEGREFTFRLRPGMKWSDGEPFTADDIIFAYTDVISNSNIASAGSAEYMDPRGELPTAEKVDDHSFRFTFSTSHAIFLYELANPEGYHLTACPRHYLSQFHNGHNPDVADLAKQEGVSTWVDLFERKRDVWDNPDLPVVFAWQPKTLISSGTELALERNPYYWKIDPDGSQLPYLNEVVFELVEDEESLLLKAANGELNMHARHFNSPQNRPVLANGREEGGYDFFDLDVSSMYGMNEMPIMLNLNHKNPKLRQLFQNKDFRVGLSQAIDREQLIQAVFQQQGEPWQCAPSSKSAYYDEQFAKQYTEYDPPAANQRLDAAGLTRRGTDGFRLHPGQDSPLTFTVDVPTESLSPAWVPAMEMIESFWAEVGVKIQLDVQSRSIWTARVDANDHDAAVFTGEGGNRDEITHGYLFIPYHAFGSRYALLWARWYQSGGEEGDEPPSAIRRQLALYDEVTETLDEEERQKLFREVLGIAKEQFYVIGTVARNNGYGIVGNDFHNVPDTIPLADAYATPGPTKAEQYFIS